MKETVYRCNRCHKLINGTVHRITVTDEKGDQTKYGSLFENTDLCDSCAEKVALVVIEEIDHAPGQQDTEAHNDEPERQQDQKEETPEILNAEPVTHQCSKVVKTCAYAERVGGALICNYIGIEGRRRGCEPEVCDKYKKAEHKRGRKPKMETERSDILEAEK